jgi:hypothetical protein
VVLSINYTRTSREITKQISQNVISTKSLRPRFLSTNSESPDKNLTPEEFVQWASSQLNIKEMSDWYNITNKVPHFKKTRDQLISAIV